jgi:hypothetical protein
MSEKEETVDCKDILQGASKKEACKEDESNDACNDACNDCDKCLIDYQNDKEFCSLCNFDLKNLKCNECNNLLNGYKDIDDSGICDRCCRRVDETPYDPYWEHMANDFSSSPEYKQLKKQKLLKNEKAYEAAYEKYQENYESWYDMRRRMAGKAGKK